MPIPIPIKKTMEINLNETFMNKMRIERQEDSLNYVEHVQITIYGKNKDNYYGHIRSNTTKNGSFDSNFSLYFDGTVLFTKTVYGKQSSIEKCDKNLFEGFSQYLLNRLSEM